MQAFQAEGVKCAMAVATLLALHEMNPFLIRG